MASRSNFPAVSLCRLLGRFGYPVPGGQACAIVALMVAISGCNGSESSVQSTDRSQPQEVVINVVTEFGAVADGTTDDEPALQSALDYAADQGGGNVYLPAGTYAISRPLVLRSHVHLTGDGPGRTVIRSQGHGLGKTVEGTGIWSAIALLSAEGASVTQLTVDLATAATHANGISLLPTGEAFEGTPSSNCRISDVEVLGGGNYHAYMIWNLRGRGIEIVNNLVDGGILEQVESNQEGIESYGGEDVLIGWNTIDNIGNTALNFGSAGAPNTGIDGLHVIGNTVRNSRRGLNIGTWLGEAGAQNIANVRIEENSFENLWGTGIFIPVQAGTRFDGLRIMGNRFVGVGTEGSNGVAGIHFEGAPVSPNAPAAAATDTSVTNNQLSGIRGVNSYGVLVNRYPGVRVANNEIDDVGFGGIQAFGSPNLTVENNRITRVGRIAVGSYGPQSSAWVRDNFFRDWGRDAPVTGVLVDEAVAGEVRRNEFQRDVAGGVVIIVGHAASDVIVFDNSLTSTDQTVATQQSQMDPFVNLSAGSNLGSFVVAAQATTMHVAHPLVSPTSQIIVKQFSGDPLSFTAVPRAGGIDVVFASAALGEERFRYEIDP